MSGVVVFLWESCAPGLWICRHRAAMCFLQLVSLVLDQFYHQLPRWGFPHQVGCINLDPTLQCDKVLYFRFPTRGCLCLSLHQASKQVTNFLIASWTDGWIFSSPLYMKRAAIHVSVWTFQLQLSTSLYVCPCSGWKAQPLSARAWYSFTVLISTSLFIRNLWKDPFLSSMLNSTVVSSLSRMIVCRGESNLAQSTMPLEAPPWCSNARFWSVPF